MMAPLRWILALCLVGLPATPAASQTEEQISKTVTAETEDGTSHAERFAVGAAYFGETITHPGLMLGGEFYIWENSWYSLISAAGVGFYTHPHSLTALFGDLEIGNRATTTFGLFVDLFVGAGYFHTWPFGDVYVRDGEGVQKVESDAGHPHVFFNGSLGLGWDLSRNDVGPLAIFARLMVFGEYPFNTTVALHGALMVGARWRFGQTGGVAR